MAQKITKPTRKKTTAKNRRIQCKKQHGHLVCWINSKSSPKKKHIILDFVLPSKRNNHKPHLIRRSSLLCIAVLLVALQAGYNYIIAGQNQILGYATNVSAQSVTDAVNGARLDQGASTLETNSALNKAASLKADDMLRKGYWSHNSPDGTQPWQWFDAAEYAYQNAGENLAKDFKTSSGVVRAWLDSESHRKNMLNPSFEDVGIAVVNGSLAGKETTLVVALFGSQKAVETAESGTVTSTTAVTSSVFANPAQISTLANPVSIITLLVLLLIMTVALLTHWHYLKLPRKIRKSWYRHHALYTAIIALLVVTYTAYIYTAGSI